MEYIVDSCPIILAKGPHSGHVKVVNELCEKHYYSSGKEWHYGVKLHAVVTRKPGRLPVSLALMVSGATQHDLPVAKQTMDNHISLTQSRSYADKAYSDADWANLLKNSHAIELITPRKNTRGILWPLVTRFPPLSVLSVSPLSAFLIGSTVCPIFSRLLWFFLRPPTSYFWSSRRCSCRPHFQPLIRINNPTLLKYTTDSLG